MNAHDVVNAMIEKAVDAGVPAAEAEFSIRGGTLHRLISIRDKHNRLVPPDDGYDGVFSVRKMVIDKSVLVAEIDIVTRDYATLAARVVYDLPI